MERRTTNSTDDSGVITDVILLLDVTKHQMWVNTSTFCKYSDQCPWMEPYFSSVPAVN